MLIQKQLHLKQLCFLEFFFFFDEEDGGKHAGMVCYNRGGNKPEEVRYSYEKSGVIAKIFLVLVVKCNRTLSNRTRENPECILEGLSQLGGAVSSLGGRAPVALLRNVTCFWEPRKGILKSKLESASRKENIFRRLPSRSPVQFHSYATYCSVQV